MPFLYLGTWNGTFHRLRENAESQGQEEIDERDVGK